MPDEDAEIAPSWEQGAPTELTVSPRLSVVLSVRLPAPVVERLSARAEREGRTESQVARDLIESGLATDLPTTPAELARAFSRWVEEVGRMTDQRKG